MRSTCSGANWAAIFVLALGVPVTFEARPASAQSLAEAARRAEEQRKASQGEALKIDKLSTRGKYEPVQEVPLDLALLNRYGEARGAVGVLMRKDPYLYERVSTQALGVPTFRAFADVLASEPAVMEQLRFHGFTAQDFVLVELTLRRAESRAASGYGSLSDVESSNTYFVWSQRNRLQTLRREWAKSDHGVSFWPEWVPYD